MTPYKIGDRVVYLHPSPTMGTALAPEVQGMVLVDLDDGRELHADPNGLRPAMPRDRADLERWGRWWWRDGEVIEISADSRGLRLWHAGSALAGNVDGPDKWAGPVAPPPEVRS